MGIDLRLLIESMETPNRDLCHTIISLERDYELWERIKRLTVFEARNEIYSWFGDNYGASDNDAYGDKLMFTTAKDVVRRFFVIMPKMLGLQLQHESTPLNNAAMEYIKALPEDTRIYLYWH